MCVGKTLNMGSCSKFWGNLEGIWGNPGEIPHSGWKIPGVYRVKLKSLNSGNHKRGKVETLDEYRLIKRDVSFNSVVERPICYICKTPYQLPISFQLRIKETIGVPVMLRE